MHAPIQAPQAPQTSRAEEARTARQHAPPAESATSGRAHDGRRDERSGKRRGHLYAQHGRPLLRWTLLVLTFPPALALCVPIALINLFQFRSLRRVLFTQPRVGLGGRVFWILKFRTMRECAGPPGGDTGQFDSWGRNLDGLRVTRFGRFLRNTHLDEVPQLVNILRGEMDFIGPRPEMIEIHEWACERVEDFHDRTALLPGVTGLAQVTQGYAGPDEAQYRRKLALDRRYLERLSLALDLEILMRTAIWMLRGRGWRRAPRRTPARSLVS